MSFAIAIVTAIATQHWVVRNYRKSGSQKSFDDIVKALKTLSCKSVGRVEKIILESEICNSLKQLERVTKVKSIWNYLCRPYSYWCLPTQMDLVSDELLHLLHELDEKMGYRIDNKRIQTIISEWKVMYKWEREAEFADEANDVEAQIHENPLQQSTLSIIADNFEEENEGFNEVFKEDYNENQPHGKHETILSPALTRLKKIAKRKRSQKKGHFKGSLRNTSHY